MQRRPGDEESHHHGLAGAGGEFERVAQEVAGLRHLAPTLHLVEINNGLDRLLLAEEEALGCRPALLVTFEPPLEQPPRHPRRARVAGLAPLAHLVPELVDDIVSLLRAGEQVLEESRLLADDPGDAALRVLRGGEEAHRRAPALSKLRAAPGQELIVLLWLLEGVADDDAVDNVGHRRSLLRQVPHDGGLVAVDVHDLDRDAFVAPYRK